MALRSLLSAVDSARTGRLKYIAAYAGSFSGLQEVEPGWMLANGAVLPSSGNSPSGMPYSFLRTMVGTKFGATGTLPTIIDGRMVIPKGTISGRTFAVGNAADFNTNGNITLSTSQMPQHRHYFTVVDPMDGETGASGIGSVGYGSEPFTNGVATGHDSQTSGALGGGGSHNNMSPYLVVGAVMVKL